MSSRKNLKEILICKLCNQIYDDPIILPCYKTVCSKHVSIEARNHVFKCLLCNKEHSIFSDGLCKNEELQYLISINDEYIKLESILGKNNVKAKEMCTELEEKIKKTILYSRDPSLYIYDYFSKLKAEIDLKREECVKMINDNYDLLIADLEEAEQKCKYNLFNLDKSICDLNKSIESSSKDLSRLVISSNKPTLNDPENWFKLREDIQQNISKSAYMLEKFQSEILLNKKYDFKLKLIPTENSFGELLKVEDYFPSENKSERTIQFQITEFKSFKQEKSYQYDKDWCIISKMKWTSMVCIKEINDYDLYLGFYVKPDCEKIDSPIKAKLSFKLVKTNGTYYIPSKNNNKTLEHTFNDSVWRGYDDFCSLKDIFDPKNEVYNKEKDSIKLEIEIKIL